MPPAGAKPLTADMIRALSEIPPERLPLAPEIFGKLVPALAEALKDFTGQAPSIAFTGLLKGVKAGGGEVARLVGAARPLDVGVEVGRDAVFVLCEQAFGGSGGEAPYGEAARPLSKIETRLREEFAGMVRAALARSLSETLGESFDASPDQVSLPAGERLTARLAVDAFGARGDILVHLSKAQFMALAEAPDTGSGVMVGDGIALGSLDVAAMLPEEEASLAELAGLGPGQLLRLKATAVSPVHLVSGGVVLFRGRLSDAGGRMAVEIVS